MKKLFLLKGLIGLLTFTASQCPHNVFASEKANYQVESQSTIDVTINVKDSKGVPVIGSSVYLANNTSKYGITSESGSVVLRGLPSSGEVTIEMLGYKTQVLPINGRAVLNVILEEEVLEMDELVVVGYSVQKKASLTASVATVDGEAVQKMQVPNTTKALQGLAPGLTVIDRGGAPGADDYSIFIRGIGTTGNTNPLILVDGVEMSLSDVPSTEIANISVLKDAASAAIYGARAGHGVILVTTKRAQEGKMTVSYSGNAGLQMRTMVPEMVTAEQYMQMVNEANYNVGNTNQYFSDEVIAKTIAGELPYVNYLDEIYNPAIINDHTVGVSGGSEKNRYLLSLNLLDQPGMVMDSYYRRYSIRMNTDFQITDDFKVSADVQIKHSERDQSEDFSEALRLAWGQQPTVPIRYDNGYYTLDDRNTNPIASADASFTGNQRVISDSYYAALTAEYATDFGLKFSGFASVNGGFGRTYTFSKEAEFFGPTGNTTGVIWNKDSRVTEAFSSSYNTTLRALASYDKSWGDHKISALAGVEQLTGRNYWNSAARTNLISTDLPVVSLGSSADGNQFAYGSNGMSGLNSFFARINYNYKEKYIFEANVRRDGSGNFAAGNKWGTFPSFSAAWRISQEDFMKNVDFVSSLKLRASWGQMGNERIGSFQYLTTLSNGTTIINGGPNTTIYQSAISNPNISWETIESTDIGISFGLFEDRFYGDLDYYSKQTKDILMTLPIPDYTGLNPSVINAGIIKNSGFEAILGYKGKSGDLRYDISGNFSYNKNEWVDRNGDDINISGSTINQLGSPLNSYYVYESDGLFANEDDLAAYNEAIEDPRGNTNLMPGDIKLKDINGDGRITPDGDRTLVHANIPVYYFGLTGNFSYRNWDLSLFFQGTAGGNVWLGGNLYEGPSFENFTSVDYLDRWTKENENPDALVPRLRLADNNINAGAGSDFYIRSNNYLRLKNAQLGYNFPMKKSKIQSIRLYVSGTNLFTLKSKHMPQGFDPENPGGSGYPPISVISIGANIKF